MKTCKCGKEMGFNARVCRDCYYASRRKNPIAVKNCWVCKKPFFKMEMVECQKDDRSPIEFWCRGCFYRDIRKRKI